MAPLACRLVILDCDGVLVDSETLSAREFVAAAREAGVDLPLAEARRSFRGSRMADCLADLERRLGGPLPADFEPRFRERVAAAFRRELRPVPGVVDALDRLDAATCVASNGPRSKMEVTLEVTGLLARFTGRVFSAYDVGCWKPDPGLFLHASLSMAVPPASCIVVEDSEAGVRAGVAAGMRVLGYAAEPDDAPGLAAAGARVFSSMAELPGLVEGRDTGDVVVARGRARGGPAQ